MSPTAVIGIGAAGWEHLGPTEQDLIRSADVLVGGARHLALVPDEVAARRCAWPRPLRDGLASLLAGHAGRRVVLLASGDPLVSGVGATVIDLLGADAVTIYPAISSVALARARMGWSAETTDVISLTTQPVTALRRLLAPGARIVVLCADASSPGAIATELRAAGATDAVLDLWSHLGGPQEEHVRLQSAAQPPPVPALTVACITCSPDLTARSIVSGLPDEAYEHDGQLTKRDLRASALARLAPLPGQLLWDVGAGAGSIGIEWLRAHPRTRAIAVEADQERAQRISRNAANLGVPDLQVVTGHAPDALATLPSPDAVFVGGAVSRPGLLETCHAALRPAGRLVAHAVTVQSEQALVTAHQRHGGELVRVHVETLESLGTMQGFRPARAVTQWSVTR